MAAAAVPLIMMGVSALGSYLGNKSGKKTEQSQTSSGTNVTNYNSQTSPTYDPLQSTARDYALNAYMNRAANPVNLAGYGMSGIRGINENSNIQQKTMANLMAAKGMSYSPAGTTPQLMAEGDRIKQITGFENSLPLLLRQLQGEDLNGLSQFLASLPTGQQKTGTDTTTSNQTQTGTNIQPGSTMSAIGAGMENGAATYLAADANENMRKKLAAMYGA